MANQSLYTPNKYLVTRYVFRMESGQPFCIYLLSTSGITLLYEAFYCNLYLLKIGVDAGLFGVSWLVQKYLIFREKEVVAYEK